MAGEEFDSLYTEREARFQRKLLEAKWFGGTIQFGKAGTIGAYTKTFEGMRKVGNVIVLRWIEGADGNGNPLPGVTATVESLHDGETDYLVVEAEYQRYDRVIRRSVREYAPIAERWAIRRWHQKRGTPVHEADNSADWRLNYITEPGFVPPTIQWELVEQEPQPDVEREEPPKRRGRPPRQAVAAA
jgi:hypothetical protein